MSSSDKPDLLRHVLATLAYRTQKASQHAPESFGSFQAGAGVRTPQELLLHMSSLISETPDALRCLPLHPLVTCPDFQGEADRFHVLLEQLSVDLASRRFQGPQLAERLLQGPFADAMTHVGQLALLRRLAGAPVPAEDFFRADIVYLLMALGRPDVWPDGDLALREAARQVKRMRARPSDDRLRRLAATWRPWRSVAARILWHQYLCDRRTRRGAR